MMNFNFNIYSCFLLNCLKVCWDICEDKEINFIKLDVNKGFLFIYLYRKYLICFDKKMLYYW